jgi:cell division protein FtsQ
MDGRGRLLRSLNMGNSGFPPAALSFAGALSVRPIYSVPAEIKPPARKARRGLTQKILNLLATPGAAASLSLLLLAAVGVYGAIKGGHYAAFVARQGEPADLIAKSLGFSVKAVTISGAHELKEQEILAIAGIGPRNSLFFLDAAKLRANLKRLPIVKEASITKLYPDRLLIEIEERQPFALWQNGGELRIIAEDGVALGLIRDRRFSHLPFVVGDGANERIDEYMALLEAAGDLRERILAGMRVARRRWTLKLTNGIDVLLPERDAGAAMARLVDLQRVYHVLDKDVLSLDLRRPDRLVARLSEQAAAAHSAAEAHTAKAKGGRS